MSCDHHLTSAIVIDMGGGRGRRERRGGRVGGEVGEGWEGGGANLPFPPSKHGPLQTSESFLRSTCMTGENERESVSVARNFNYLFSIQKYRHKMFSILREQGFGSTCISKRKVATKSGKDARNWKTVTLERRDSSLC